MGETLGKNLAESLFDKSDELIKKVSKTLDLVGDDNAAIDSIKGILRKSKKGKIKDAQLENAFSETVDFYETYKNRVSGDFPDRFVQAKGKKGAVQAENELQTAKNFLEGNSRLGDVREVYGIPTDSSNTGIPTPDFRVTDANNISRLAEVKTLDKPFTENNLQRNLSKAINQTKIKATDEAKAYLIIDYSKQPVTTLSRERIKNYTEFLLTNPNDKGVKGNDFVEYVELTYNDATGKVKLLFENGKLVQGN